MTRCAGRMSRSRSAIRCSSIPKGCASVADLTASIREGVGLAAILSRKGASAEAVGAVLGLEPPQAPRLAGHGSLQLIGTGPENWLALAPGLDPDWAADLAARLSGLASVSDQSGSYAIFRIGGA